MEDRDKKTQTALEDAKMLKEHTLKELFLQRHRYIKLRLNEKVGQSSDARLSKVQTQISSLLSFIHQAFANELLIFDSTQTLVIE